MPKKYERAAIYVRESDPTLADSTTIDSAVKALRDHCAKEGYSLGSQHEYKEAISAYQVPYYERARLMDMLKAAQRKEFDVVCITEVRALSRKGAAEVLLIYQTLMDAGVRLETTQEKFSDDPTGELILTWKATYARLERQQSYLRMQRGKRDRIVIGQAPSACSKPPYGYTFIDTDREVKGAYVFNLTIIYVDADGVEWSEYKVAVYIFDLLKQGETLHGVARILNEKGIPPRGNTRTAEPHWRASGIRNMINNPIYTGGVYVNRFKKVEKVNRFGIKKLIQIDVPREQWIRLPDAPAIIDKESYERIMAQVAANRNESVRNNKHDDLGLVRSGYCICGVCRRSMTLDYPGPKPESKGSTPGYRCRQTATAKQSIVHNHNTFIRQSIVDAAVREKIIETLQDVSWVRTRVEDLRKANKPSIDAESVHTTIASLQKEIDNLFDLARYATNDKNRERLGMLMQDLERQQQEAEGILFDLEDDAEERAKLEVEIVRFEKWAEEVRPNLTDPSYMETASYSELRLAIRVLGIVVTVYPSQGEWPYRFNIDCA